MLVIQTEKSQIFLITGKNSGVLKGIDFLNNEVDIIQINCDCSPSQIVFSEKHLFILEERMVVHYASI